MLQEIIIFQIKRHFSLKVVSLACLTLCYPTAFAIGFGNAVVRSNLGDVLRLQVAVLGSSEDILVPSCFKSKIETLSGELIDNPRIEFVMPNQANRAVFINLVSNKVMVEPAVKFTISMTCGSITQREYPILLDFAESPSAITQTAPAPAVSDVQVSSINAGIVNKSVRRSPSGVAASDRSNGKPQPVNARDKIAPAAPAAYAAIRPAKHKESGGKDVLRVANEDSEFDLKMSQSLTEPATATTATPDQQRIQENKLAQAQFAAIMRGEDPFVAAQNAVKTEQLKNQNLQAELERIRQQTAQQNALKEQKDKGLSPLLISLIAAVTALLLALVALIAIAVRKSRQSKDSTWWDASAEQKQNVVDIVDYLQTSAEEGKLDPGPITTSATTATTATTRDSAGKDHAVNVEVSPGPIAHEEVVPKFKPSGLPALEDTNSSTFNFFGNRGQSIHIEEISDITQEAEFWMSVNDPHRAIEILEPQSLDENPSTPVTWLYLLDLYRLVGDEDNYRDLTQRFKHKFNAKIPGFHEEIVPGSVRSLEDFPHLIANCCALWETDDISNYLESLLVDDREGERVGFDLPVYRDILFLLSIASELKRLQYRPMPKDDESKRATLNLTAQEVSKYTIKPDAPAPIDYSDSLNFDLLDFKNDGKDKT